MSATAQTSATEEKFTTTGGLSIFFRSWHPADKPRGVVVIVPGFNSHSGYYAWVAQQLTELGLAVYALDLRGRGNSDGERFFINSFTEYVADVDGMMNIARSREPGLPVYVLGHSAGGVVSCLYTHEHQSDLAGLICESFAFRVPAPDIALAVLKGISHLAPHAHALHLKNRDFSRDPEVVRRMDEDPLISNESQPTLTVAEMVRADEKLEQSFGEFTLPLLILHGTEDKATKFSGSEFFYDHAGATDKTLKLYEGHYHDLLNDVGRETVMGDIKDWLRARLRPSS